MEPFRQAYEALLDRVAAIGWWALALGVPRAIGNSAARTRAWRNILAAAYPHSPVRWWDTFRAYYAGVGINSVVPARAGDVVKLFLMKRRVRDSTYPTLASSLLAESVFDALMATGLLIWAWQLGIVPDLPSVPSLPLFELSWYADPPWILAVIGGVLLIALIYAAVRVRSFWARVKQGLVILTMPAAYLRRVALLQAVGWVLKVASAYWFLTAFNVPATLEAALLVQVATSVGTLLPATPWWPRAQAGADRGAARGDGVPRRPARVQRRHRAGDARGERGAGSAVPGLDDRKPARGRRRPLRPP